MVAQVQEDQPAMIAPAVDPARQAHMSADVGLAKLAASVGAIGVHDEILENGGFFGGLWGGGQGRVKGLWAMPIWQVFPDTKPG
jgi:hypothetical protein